MIDHDHLDRQTAGDTALQHELLTLFIGQLDEVERVLASRERGTSAADMARLLHRVRGAAEAIGARGLARTLAEAETGCAEPAGAMAWLAPLRSAVSAARADLSRLIAAEDRGGLAKPRESR